MPLGRAEKKYLNFSRGINTEAPLTAWPEGFTIDEQNFDLFPDGSRRRRPVIDFERGGAGADLSVNDLAEGDACRVEFWNAVNNDAAVNFIVLQVGFRLYFFNRPAAGDPVEPEQTSHIINLLDFRVRIIDPAYTASTANVRATVVDMTFGNGRMYVVGKHTEPFFVEYDSENDQMLTQQITVQERDFNGIEDGIAITTQPTTLEDTHLYNLHNRGWSPVNYTAYFSDVGKYPSKSQIMFRGMQRQESAGINVEDGIKEFSPDKLVAETFQDSSAPQGHLRLNTFDTREAFDPGGVSSGGTITSYFADTFVSNETDLRCISENHGLSVGQEINIIDLDVQFFLIPLSVVHRIYNGVYEVIAVSGTDEFTIHITDTPDDAFGAGASGEPFGTWSASSETTFITRSTDDADALRFRFTATQFFAGRVWYAGALDARLGNKVYFSRISEDPEKSGQCYQQADPTSEFISELVATDGGVIVIPEMQDVLALAPFGHFLLVFARNGVWQIGPGELGIFSPTSYSVRKVSENGCIGRFSVIVAENTPMYWAADGIYAISQDPNSGYLLAQNITRDVINNLYMNIPFSSREGARAVYDFYRKRIFFFYNPQQPLQTATPDDDGEDMPTITPVTPILDPANGEATVGLTHALIFDLRLQAWYKWAFHNGSGTFSIQEPFSLENDYTVNNETRIKLITRIASNSNLDIREFRSDVTGFSDFGGTSRRPDAFIATGPDSLGEPAKFRYAPIVTCFFKRIEGAACQMQARWDWARGTISGKMSNFFNVYRETRPNPNAFAMTVTRNKIPGRGRNLFLFFKVTGDDDAWLDGYTVEYNVLMKE